MSRSLTTSSRSFFTIPTFLAPAFSNASLPATNTIRAFSCTAKYQSKKKAGDANKSRGVSAIRSTGPKKRAQFAVVDSWGPLPQPDPKAPARRAEFEAQYNKEHGLYGFFGPNKESMLPPAEEGVHGRAWTTHELMIKSFYDLWKLHWVCIKELNRISTRHAERGRLRLGYGREEAEKRMQTVKRTIRNIRMVLLQRHEDDAAAQRLFQKVPLAELFPDAEASLGLAPSLQIQTQPEIHVTEIDGDLSGGQQTSDTIIPRSKKEDIQEPESDTSVERKRKLAE